MHIFSCLNTSQALKQHKKTQEGDEEITRWGISTSDRTIILNVCSSYRRICLPPKRTPWTQMRFKTAFLQLKSAETSFESTSFAVQSRWPPGTARVIAVLYGLASEQPRLSALLKGHSSHIHRPGSERWLIQFPPFFCLSEHPNQPVS